MNRNAGLPPDVFKAELKSKEWTGRALGVRWNKSETWISKIVNDPCRDRHWDDAVIGLCHASQTVPQLTPVEAKALIKARGWTSKELAVRWGKSPTWVSKVLNAIDRDLHWDDAIMGLPDIKTPTDQNTEISDLIRLIDQRTSELNALKQQLKRLEKAKAKAKAKKPA